MLIDVQPLSQVLSRCHVHECQLLHIDTEGYDLKVLSTLDFGLLKPSAIFVEHKHLSRDARSALLRLLAEQHYSVRDFGSDYFALLKKGSHLHRAVRWVPRP